MSYFVVVGQADGGDRAVLPAGAWHGSGGRPAGAVGLVFIIGLRWRDAPSACGPHKTLYDRFVRWSRVVVFDRVFAILVGQAGERARS